MISKKRLLLLAATNIADKTNLDNDTAMNAAKAAFDTISLAVISPLLDVLDFDTRPLYRERVANEVKDLLAQDASVVIDDGEPKSIEVPNE